MIPSPFQVTISAQRRTKIVATLGPASREPDILNKLLQAGVNVFRLNLAHGEHIEHRQTFERVRELADKAGIPIAVFADLCGPKIRVGTFQEQPVILHEGDSVTVTIREVEGSQYLIPVSYNGLADDVRPGDRILINDGLVELRVERVEGTEVRCVVQTGGLVGNRKGVNLPGVPLSFATLTDKDRIDASFALELGVDFLALSFVRRPEDVRDLKALIQDAGHTTPVIAKIERPEALAVIDEILDVTDAVMVARGDLGVELDSEAVPVIQQNLLERARLKNKPIIVATQMLESMVDHPRPTRAEVSDVSHAVFGGADALMLSAETAAGAYPVRAVEMMDKVAHQVEGWQLGEDQFASLSRPLELLIETHGKGIRLPFRVAVARSTTQLAREMEAVHAIVIRTRAGNTAHIIAATRPSVPVVAMTMDPAVYHRLSLVWGVIPRLVSSAEFEQPQEGARRVVQELGVAKPGEVVLLVAGFGKGEPSIRALIM